MPRIGNPRLSLFALLQAVDEAGAKQIESAALAIVTVFRNIAAQSVTEAFKKPPEGVEELLKKEDIRKALDNTAEKLRTELFADYLPQRDHDRLTLGVDLPHGISEALLKTAKKQAAAKDVLRK